MLKVSSVSALHYHYTFTLSAFPKCHVEIIFNSYYEEMSYLLETDVSKMCLFLQNESEDEDVQLSWVLQMSVQEF